MAICDQFIYTSAKTKAKEGYQIIAQSSGISEELVSDLRSYLYPVGLDLNIFEESRSLVVLKSDKIAYSIVKNIGAGYDSRKGTLYNHTFVMDKSDFNGLGADSRFFDKHFILNPNLQDKLQRIKIESYSMPIRFEPLKSLDSSNLQQLLYNYFLRKRIALIINGNNVTLIPNFLACLPPSMRLISFSTLVNEPAKQHEYDLVQISKNAEYKLGEEWKKIGISSPPDAREEPVSSVDMKEFHYLATLIQNEDEIMLRELHQAFDKLPTSKNQSKIRFLAYQRLSDVSKDKTEKAEYAYECAKAAGDIDGDLAAQYLKVARQYSIEARATDLLARIEMGELAISIDKEPLNLFNIERMLDRLPSTDRETKSLILSKILQRKMRASSNEVLALLKETMTSSSYYRDEILRIFVANTKLSTFILPAISESGRNMTSNQYYALHEKLVKLSIMENSQLLEELVGALELDFDRKGALRHLKDSVFAIYSEPKIREDTPPDTILRITSRIRNKFDSALDHQLIEDTSTKQLRWHSDQDYEDFKHTSFDVMHDIIRCLRYVVDYRKGELNSSTRSSFLTEIGKIESLLTKLASVFYIEPPRKKPTVEYREPTWLDLLFNWWGFKR